MRVPFTFNLTASGHCIHQIEGYAVISACDMDPDEWAVDAIVVQTDAERGVHAAPVLKGEPLFNVLLEFLLGPHRGEVDSAWDRREPAEREYEGILE